MTRFWNRRSLGRARSTRIGTAALAAVVPFVVYGLSASPNPAFWDSGEMQTVSYLFGIAHPTGFPLFVMIGWVFTHAIPFGSVAWRVTMVSSAGCAGAAYAAWFALDTLECSPWVAMSAAWWFAFGDTVWQRANRTDVHGLLVGFEALSLAFAIRFAVKGERVWGVASCAAAGLALATHSNAIWLLPGLIVLLLSRRGLPHVQALGALLAPLLTYLYIPFRSTFVASHQLDPTREIGVPPGQPFWNYGDPEGFRNFWWLISGAQWSSYVHGAFRYMLIPQSYLSGISLFTSFARADHGTLELMGALAGVIVLCARAWKVALAMVVSGLCWIAFISAYQSIEADPARYLLCVFWIEAVCAGSLWFVLRRVPRFSNAVAGLMVVASLLPLWADRARFLESSDPLAAPYIDRVIRETGPRDVVIAPWTYVTPLGYAKYVESRMGDRIVVNGGPPDWNRLTVQLARHYPTDIVLERAVAIPGVTLRPLDHAFPRVFRVIPERPANKSRRHPHREGVP